VGHEIDFTIADLAADRRAATPSAAAELVSPSAEHLGQRLRALEQRLVRAEAGLIERLRRRHAGVDRHLRLLHPAAALQRLQQRADEMERRLTVAVRRRLAVLRGRREALAGRLAALSPARRLEALRRRIGGLAAALLATLPRQIALRRERLAGTVHALEALSPLGTLSRGYAIVRRLPDGLLVRDAAQLTPGDRIETRLARGLATARVESCRPVRAQAEDAIPKRPRKRDGP
jgi:exodeoxyribonuclease VII large subunit